MLKTSPQSASALPVTSINDSKVISSSSKNNRKLTKSDFTKLVRRAEKPSFLTPNTRRAFAQLKQAFTEAPIFQHFNVEHYI